MIAAARQAAYDVLRAVTSGRADLPAALARERGQLDDERDRALAGEIATGTLRWMGTFDHLIAHYTGRPLAKLDPEVLDILRMTAFQVLHLDRVPASAAVNDAVNLARKAKKKSAVGLVNAVLRRLSRERKKLPLPRRPESAESSRDAAIAYLSISLSHPAWLVERWLDRYGFQAAEAWARFNNEAAPLTLRANTLRGSRAALAEDLRAAGVETEPTLFAPHGLVVRRGNPLLTPLAGTGRFVVQDEASQLVALMMGAKPGERIFDACASPGGKTTAMAAAMDDRGLVVAADVRERRVGLLARTVAEAGTTVVRIVRANAAAPLPFGSIFDAALLDAPCSGLGTIRRDPEIRWRRQPTELERLSTAQVAMLREVARTVRPGGRILYATCSSEPEENEDVVSRVLEAEPGLALAPDAIPSDLVRFRTPSGHFRTLPFRDGLEAFFGAILVRDKDLR